MITLIPSHQKLPGASRDRLRELARHVVLSAQSLTLRPSRTPALRHIYCHYVFAEQRRAFEAVIRYIQSIGEFVNAERALDILYGRAPLTKNTFHLSFDDGLKCVVENALPVLRGHGVPATIFVPTAVISAPEGRYGEIAREYVAPRPDAGFASWDDLEKAKVAGFDIGAHSRTHTRLSLASNSRSALEDEIAGSKEDVERRLGECRYISWPYGRLVDIEDAALDIVRQAGFQACFGGFRGQVVPKVTDAYRIPRHHYEPDWPLSHVKCFVHGAWES